MSSSTKVLSIAILKWKKDTPEPLILCQECELSSFSYFQKNAYDFDNMLIMIVWSKCLLSSLEHFFSVLIQENVRACLTRVNISISFVISRLYVPLLSSCRWSWSCDCYQQGVSCPCGLQLGEQSVGWVWHEVHVKHICTLWEVVLVGRMPRRITDSLFPPSPRPFRIIRILPNAIKSPRFIRRLMRLRRFW